MSSYLREISFLTALLGCLVNSPLLARPEEERPELGRFFAAENVTGTFVSYDVRGDAMRVYNPVLAARRFVPASTFKIVNSVIGLETKAVASVDEVLPYGGRPQRLKIWEKDMSLRAAISVSNVPVYQELARRIGLPGMAGYVKKFSYGNGEIGLVVDRFWLDGPLAISALEQAEFLGRLITGKLQVSAPTLAAVKEITLLETTRTSRLHAKTGWADRSDPDIGWWVGWVEREGAIVSFALNIEIKSDDDAPKRVTIARRCLESLGQLGK